MVDQARFAIIDKEVDRHGLTDSRGPHLVGGVSLLVQGTGLFADSSVLPHIRTEQAFREYMKFHKEALKLVANELIAASNSPVDLFDQTARDERLFQDRFSKFVILHDEYAVVLDDTDRSTESWPYHISPHCVFTREYDHIDHKNQKDALSKKLHRIRRYYAYRKGLLQLDFIKWNSDPEEVLKQIKESTRWSDELDDYELQQGLEVHIRLLKRLVSELGSTSTSSSMSELKIVALDEINSCMSFNLEDHLQFLDQRLMKEYFYRVKIRNLARECYNQAEMTGVILVEQFLPIRHLEEYVLPKKVPLNLGEKLFPRNFPQMKQRVKRSLESTMGYLHRQGATRARALNLFLLGALSVLTWSTSHEQELESNTVSHG